MALSRPFKEDRLALPSFHASLLQAIDGVMPLVLCPQVVKNDPTSERTVIKVKFRNSGHVDGTNHHLQGSEEYL